MKVVGKSVRDVRTSPPRNHLEGVPSPRRCSVAWAYEHQRRYGGACEVWTVARMGQLRWALKHLSPDVRFRFIAFVVGRWAEFAASVKLQAGMTAVPTRPSVGFLVKHVSVAVNMFVAHLDAKTDTSGASFATNAPAPGPKHAPAPSPEDAAVSVEDLKGMFGDG